MNETLNKLIPALRGWKPWRGTHRERVARLRRYHRKACHAIGLPIRLHVFAREDAGPLSTGNSCFIPPRTIILVGRFSVMTYLHELAHAVEWNTTGSTSEQSATQWSHHLFKTLFPLSYSRLVFRDGMMVKRGEVQ